MSHYKSNLRDIEFNLFEVFNTQEILGSAPFGEVDADTAREVLAEVDRLAREELAASYEDSDRNPPVFDPATHTAPLPESFKKSYQAWMDAEFWRLQIREELGGTPAPSSLNWAIGEMVLGSNAPIHMYAAGAPFAGVVYDNGNERDKRIAQIMVERQWGCTMVLTEPDAGSDVGAGRARATLNDDGSWNITGVKRFITSAEHDMSENIMHLVLARPVGIEGVGGPGTKGLSLFWMPTHHFDHETGELTGERNGVYVTAVEHKMGIKVSNTCEVTFGDPQVGGGEPAQGWLLGEVHEGIAQMFQVIENARMMVGTKAISTLSTGYLNALEYAKERVQGADMTQMADKTAPRVSIMHHPDVRRALLTQKAYSEGLRAVYLFTAAYQDVPVAEITAGIEGALAHRVNDLLLPIVKGVGSERAYGVLTEALQTYGGSGYLQDYPVEQYIRDAKIDSLYEGTTAIQAQDFFFRKIARDKGEALTHLMGRMQASIEADGHADLAPSWAQFQTALGDVQAMVGTLTGYLMGAQEDATQLYKVGLGSVDFLMAVGDLVIGWLLLDHAEIAQKALDAGADGTDRSFYEGKVAVAGFFARTMLPRLSSIKESIAAIDTQVMELAEASF